MMHSPCIFRVEKRNDGTYAFRADNNLWLGCIGRQSNKLNLEASKPNREDVWAIFHAEIYAGNRIRLKNKDGKYWQWVSYSSDNERIELNQNTADGAPYEFWYENPDEVDNDARLPEKIVLRADNYRYLSCASNSYIDALKSTKDAACVFQTKKRDDGTYAFRASNHLWLGCVSRQGAHYNLEASKPSADDPWAIFSIELLKGNRIRIRHKDGRYWQWVFYKELDQRIELRQNSADGPPYEFAYEPG